ncbi:uncharacterized protein LOC134437508 [Engraulis encrasicolus]|uniref:uncharacterized protein LOC134437508 n=1 Tax=Engraulis encrasicolus TaxID=184585 RepID=UPI002FD188AD
MMKPLCDTQLCLFLFSLCAQVHLCSEAQCDANLTVWQSPRNLDRTEGEKAEIHCSWEKNGRKVSWKINGKKIDSKRNNQIIIKTNGNASVLIILNTSRDDAGFYVCHVVKERPKLLECNGNGTQLTVHAKTNDTFPQGDNTTEVLQLEKPGLPSAVIVPLAVVGGLLMICVPLIICRKRQRRNGNNIIRETVATDGEELGNMDEHGEDSSCNSSRGSSQWCQVPVYEAYFDHRRDCADGEKDSKQ